MKRFEYKILTARSEDGEINREIQKTLDTESQKGWELVNTNRDEYPADNRNGAKILLVLKRRID